MALNPDEALLGFRAVSTVGVSKPCSLCAFGTNEKVCLKVVCSIDREDETDVYYIVRQPQQGETKHDKV